MTKKRVRSVPIYVWVRPEELEAIRDRMAEAGKPQRLCSQDGPQRVCAPC